MKNRLRTVEKIFAETVAAYLVSIKPRLINRPAGMPGRYYAHRGLHDNLSDAPENTMAAFQKAVENGYGIELDVQLTKDNQVVVAHDFDLKRICKVEKDIDTLTYEELRTYTILQSQERIPLLKDVLKLVKGRVPLIVEMKVKTTNSRICEKADAVLRGYHGVYCIESFHPIALWWYRLHRPEVSRGQLSSKFSLDGLREIHYMTVQHLLTNFLTAPDFIAYDYRHRKAFSKNICRRLYRCPSYAWTIHDQRELDEAKKYYDYFIFEGFLPQED